MSRLTEKDVTWFLENLELQIEDLERQKEDETIEIYFDTADMLRAVLGLQAFFQDAEEFDEQLFNNDKTLVRCLATSGWLGTIRMLPSHQDEFLSLMNINFGLGSEANYPHRKDIFLEFIKENISSDKSKQIPIHKIGEEIAEDEMVDFVRQIKQQAESAESLFKAFECIGRWQPRLARLIRENSLYLEPEKFKYAEIISSNIFHELKSAFDERRKSENMMNNFADALAVAALIERVKLYKEKKTKKLPRFYVSTRLFRDVIEMAGVGQHLIYREPDRIDSEKSVTSIVTDKCSVLRRADYFIFKAAFGSQSKAHRSQAQTTTFAGMNLYKLHNAVTKIFDARARLMPTAVRSIEIEGRSLNDIIEEVRQFSFLNNIWLRFIKTEDLKKLRDLEEEARILVKKEQVSKAIEATREALEVNVNEYKQVKSIWQELKQSSQVLQARTSKNIAEQIDVFRDLGLLRFSFPERVHRRIEEVLDAILRGGDNEQRVARNWVIIAYYSESNDLDEETDNLALVSAVLWSVEMDKRLIKRLEESLKAGTLKHYSLKMIFAAAIFRSSSNLKRGRHTSDLIEKGRQMLYDLTDEFTYTRERKKRIDLAIGLAYLHFHLWWSLGYRSFWYPPSETTKHEQADEGVQLINQAIDYSKQAYDLLHKDDMIRRVYTLNQYLYYLVMAGGVNRGDEMDNAAASLASYKANRDWWQYRCDDTLARYFHRMAVFATTEEEWKTNMDLAHVHIEEAQRASHGDSEIENYVSIFGVDYNKRRHVSMHI